MNRILTAAALALVLSAPIAARACDITTNPVSQDEVEAAGLGPLLRQADQQLGEDTHALTDQIKTKPQAEAASVAIKQVQDAYHNRMVILAKRARCGAAD